MEWGCEPCPVRVLRPLASPGYLSFPLSLLKPGSHPSTLLPAAEPLRITVDNSPHQQ